MDAMVPYAAAATSYVACWFCKQPRPANPGMFCSYCSKNGMPIAPMVIAQVKIQNCKCCHGAKKGHTCTLFFCLSASLCGKPNLHNNRELEARKVWCTHNKIEIAGVSFDLPQDNSMGVQLLLMSNPIANARTTGVVITTVSTVTSPTGSIIRTRSQTRLEAANAAIATDTAIARTGKRSAPSEEINSVVNTELFTREARVARSTRIIDAVARVIAAEEPYYSTGHGTTVAIKIGGFAATMFDKAEQAREKTGNVLPTQVPFPPQPVPPLYSFTHSERNESETMELAPSGTLVPQGLAEPLFPTPVASLALPLALQEAAPATPAFPMFVSW